MSNRKKIWGWFFYDWASQPFHTLLMTFVFGPYFAIVASQYYLGLGQDETRLLDITVALSFQDLVAQRVKKLVTILEDVQSKLLKLVVTFRLKQDQDKVEKDGRGQEMLKQLEASNNTAIQQDLVDDILGEFGFN